MKAWQLDNASPASELIFREIPQPRPGLGEILVRVRAAGVTPTELLWYPTTHAKTGEIRNQAVPGHEFSGVVAAVGQTTSGVVVGQDVYGMNDWFADGAMAEYCLTRPEWVAPKPPRLTHAEAAAVPIGALTAWQGLLDRAKLKSGERILIHGGSGAVGVFAIQLARRQGAHVITTASARNREFLLQVGAKLVIDYRTQRFEDFAKEIDVVFDTVGGATLQRSWPQLGRGGRMVTVATASEGESDDRTKNAFFIVEPNREQLTEIGDLLETGELQSVVDAMVPFAMTDAAFAAAPDADAVPTRLGRGKAVVAVGG